MGEVSHRRARGSGPGSSRGGQCAGKRRRGALAVGLALLALGPLPAFAGPPTDQLKTAVDQVIHILNDPALKGKDRAEDRRRAIREVSDTIFDWQETARRALGAHWRQRTDAERARFVSLFRDLLERTYLGKLELYRGEKVKYAGESVDDSGVAEVRTVIESKQDQQIPAQYVMLRRGDRWLVYDVVIEHVSLVGNYRSQFNDIIRTTSYAELVKKMEAKIVAMDTAGQ
jgi:phospholipid transport system substrate-binding protein